MATGKPRALERLDELKNPRNAAAAAESALETIRPDDQGAGEGLPGPGQAPAAQKRGRTEQTEDEAGQRRLPQRSGRDRLPGPEIRRTGGRPVPRRRHVTSLRGINQSALAGRSPWRRLLFYLPDLVVGFLGSSRKQAIFLALPDALDLMVVCVEAGLGLDQAMRKVADEMKRTYRVLAEEFALTNFQLQMGRPRAEVLHELGARTGVSDLRSLAAVLIQADQFGSSVAQALRVQSDSMRIRRRQLAEEKAAKTAVKLIFPLVLFIFPGIFVVLVGPAAITMVRRIVPGDGRVSVAFRSAKVRTFAERKATVWATYSFATP